MTSDILANFLSIESVDSLNFTKFGGGLPCILGIDEAGRGPVLGPMVYGCAAVFCHKEDEMKQMGVKDSKALSEAQRERIFAKMQQSEILSYSCRVVHPRVISVQMKRKVRQSLNDISHSCAIELIRRALASGICIKEVFVDLVGVKEETHQAFLQSHFPSLKITVTKRADSLFPIVGAASIVAKVTRDWRMRDWQFEENGFEATIEELGSGYPHDPITKRFISRRIDPVFGFPSLARFSWKTVESVLAKKAFKCCWNETSIMNTPKQSTLVELWAAAVTSKGEEKPKKRLRRHAFFKGLSNVQQLD